MSCPESVANHRFLNIPTRTEHLTFNFSASLHLQQGVKNCCFVGEGSNKITSVKPFEIHSESCYVSAKYYCFISSKICNICKLGKTLIFLSQRLNGHKKNPRDFSWFLFHCSMTEEYAEVCVCVEETPWKTREKTVNNEKATLGSFGCWQST